MTGITYPNLCKTCGGACCGNYPHVLKHEAEVIMKATGRELELTNTLGPWYKFTEPCPVYDKETGCKLERNDRPVICNMYPYSPIPTSGSGYLVLLDTRVCPFWQSFGCNLRDAERALVEALSKVTE